MVVYGHGGEAVPTALAADDLRWALQEPQLGTGHAVMQAVPELLDDRRPRSFFTAMCRSTSARTRSRGWRTRPAATAWRSSPWTWPIPPATGASCATNGEIHRIVEHKDADEATRAIREVNTGILVAPTAALKRWLAALSNDNAQREYYLTDIVAAAVARGHAGGRRAARARVGDAGRQQQGPAGRARAHPPAQPGATR